MIKLHIPVEQYGFVEVELPHDTTFERTKLVYDSFKSAFGITPASSEYYALKEKNFNEIVDGYLLGKINADDYAELTFIQQQVIQTIKRSLARIKAKQN